ncbi:MAG: hypothetical protein QM775_01810 [Pirellulales bacterium]
MEDLLPILAPAALVLGALLLVRGSLIGGCLAVMLSVCCFGYELIHFDVGPLPLTIDRIALGLVIGMYVWQRRAAANGPEAAEPGRRLHGRLRRLAARADAHQRLAGLSLSEKF